MTVDDLDPPSSAPRARGSAHGPKVAALVAYAEGALSAEGRRRVERHLAGCALCRATLAQVRAYAAVVEEARRVPAADFLRGAPTDEAAWARLEGSLPRPRPRWTRLLGDGGELVGGWRWALGGVVAVAFAAALALRAAPSPAPTPVAAVVSAPAEARPVPARAPAALELTAWAGEVTVDGVAVESASAALREGAVVRTGPGAVVHAAFGTAAAGATRPWADGPTGFTLGPDAHLVLEQVRAGAVVLGLRRGALSSEVGPLAADAGYAVRAEGYAVRVRGTRFLVAAEGGALRVAVAEGVVEVDPEDAGPATRLEAGAAWTSRAGRLPPPLSDDTLAQVAAPFLPPGAAGDVAARVLTLPPAAGVVAWSLGETRFDAAAPIRLRLRPSLFDTQTIELAALDRLGARTLARVPLGRDPLPVGAFEPRAPAHGHGVLTPEQIAPVVRRGQRLLRTCYERAARLSGREDPFELRLRLRIGRQGDVVDARVVEDGGAPAELGVCVAERARGWLFPAPEGGLVDVELPIRFGPGRARPRR